MHNFDSFTSAMDDNFEIFDCFEPNRVADPCDLDYPFSYNLMEKAIEIRLLNGYFVIRCVCFYSVDQGSNIRTIV